MGGEEYAFADGKERSCELMVDRVSELFDDIKIDGYVAINMISVLEINDAIGGVTVTVENEDTAEKMGIEVGSSVHVKEKPAVVTDMMAVLEEHMVTDLSVVDIAQIVSSVTEISAEKITYRTLEGKVVLGADGYEEFYPSRWKLKKIIEEIK